MISSDLLLLPEYADTAKEYLKNFLKVYMNSTRNNHYFSCIAMDNPSHISEYTLMRSCSGIYAIKGDNVENSFIYFFSKKFPLTCPLKSIIVTDEYINKNIKYVIFRPTTEYMKEFLPRGFFFRGFLYLAPEEEVHKMNSTES